jgi:hypothetical protein
VCLKPIRGCLVTKQNMREDANHQQMTRQRGRTQQQWSHWPLAKLKACLYESIEPYKALL